MRTLCAFVPALLLLAALAPAAARAENIVFPADAGVVDVTKPPYNAVPNDTGDDTAAIQKAIDDHPNKGAIIYLPNGEYRITDTLRWSGTGGGAQKRIILQGQSEYGSILQLPDACPGFTDPQKPKAMIWTGKRPAQRFGNAIRNLTVNTGSKNSGAIGVQFMANNQGCMRQVSVISSDSEGVIGLDLGYTDEQGPCLIQDVRVIGFDTGISCRYAVDSIVFERIMLRFQNRIGLDNDGQCLSIRSLSSFSHGLPVIHNRSGASLITLIEASMVKVLPGNGEVPRTAITNDAALFARHVTFNGYPTGIVDKQGKHAERQLTRYVSPAPLRLFEDSPARPLALPVKETPGVPWDNVKDWVSPTRFGAVPNDDGDDAEAIQKAIDAGKTTVYLPRGNYRISGTIVIRGKVRRIVGCEANLAIVGPLSREEKPVFRFAAGAAPVVVIERLSTGFMGGPFFFIEHESPRTLVLSSVAINFQGAGSYRNTGTGDLFIEDVVGGDWRFRHQRVWARQFNVENEGTHVTNDGGDLWILGFKTERGGTLIHTKNGGRTEVLGGFCYTTTKGRLAPMFVSEDSAISVTIGESWFNREDSPYTVLVRETRGGVTKELRHGDAPGRTGGSMLPLFSGYNEKAKGASARR